VRRRVRELAIALKFSLIEQTKVVTATSEIARNTLIYGNGGEVVLEVLHEPTRCGLKLTFIDHGPGIVDLEQALTDHFTSGKGLGLGLGGSKRLMSEFEISSQPYLETRVMMIRWRNK